MTITEKMEAMAPIYAKHLAAARKLAETGKGRDEIMADNPNGPIWAAVEAHAKRAAIAEFNATYA